MKKTLPVISFLGLISLSGFVKEPVHYEQITFNYFVSDILRSDFTNITSFKFKGATEESYSSLGTYEFCLKPAAKLGSLIKEATKGTRGDAKEIKYENINGLTILHFKSEAKASRLCIYPSVRVAEKYYVFLSFETANGLSAKYVFELTPDGNISRSCKLN